MNNYILSEFNFFIENFNTSKNEIHEQTKSFQLLPH